MYNNYSGLAPCRGKTGRGGGVWPVGYFVESDRFLTIDCYLFKLYSTPVLICNDYCGLCVYTNIYSLLFILSLFFNFPIKFDLFDIDKCC